MIRQLLATILLVAFIGLPFAYGQGLPLSGLPSASSVNGTDLFYDVQTPGTGGVKVTGQQIATSTQQLTNIFVGPNAPSANSTLAADWLWGPSADRTLLINEGSIWTTNTYVGVGVARSFNSSNNGTGSPAASLFAYGYNNGSANDVAGLIADANAATSNAVVFGSNFIARSNGGSLTNVKVVGAEIDVQPAGTDSINSGSAGLYINAFNKTIPVAIQIGTAGGGGWTNSIIAPGFTVNGSGAVFATGTANVTTASSNNPTINIWDTTQGGWNIFSNGSGVLNISTANTSGNFVTNDVTLDRSGNLTVLNGKITAPEIVLTPTTIAGLPACNSGNKGMMAFVSDTTASATATYHGTVSGSGASTVNSPVSCNGSNWQYD